MAYTSLNDYCLATYGRKLYKLALNSGAVQGAQGTCPNRDGLLDTRGCIFCSAGGSGDFAENNVEAAKARTVTVTAHTETLPEASGDVTVF